MQISIRPLRVEDARAVVDAEDDETVRWLSEEKSTIRGTEEYIARLARDAEQGKPKRAFGIWLDGHCVGTIDDDLKCPGFRSVVRRSRARSSWGECRTLRPLRGCGSRELRGAGPCSTSGPIPSWRARPR